MNSSRIVLSIISALALLGGACSDDGPVATSTGSVSGRVLDAASLQPIAGARVTATPGSHSVLAGADGRYTIEHLQVGSVLLRASSDGYLGDSLTVQVSAGGSTSADLGLRRDGPINNALEFDGALTPEGTDPGVRVVGSAEEPVGTGPLTIEAWIRPSGFGDKRWNWVLSKGPTYNLLFGIVDGQPFLQAANTASFAHGSTKLIPGLWYHLAGVRDPAAGKIRLYLNGVLDADASISGDVGAVAGDFVIGKYVGDTPGGENGFQGIIHELRIWTTVRSPSQLAAMMTGRATGAEAGLLHCWPLNDGSGATVRDLGTAGRNGTFINTPHWVSAETPLD